jgi:hypothetical protein
VKGQSTKLLKLKTVVNRLVFIDDSPKTWKSPRDAQRDAQSNKVSLDRLSYCCAFCKEAVFPSCRQQPSVVTKMASEAVSHYTVYLLSSRCASRGKSQSSRICLRIFLFPFLSHALSLALKRVHDPLVIRKAR